MRICIEYTIPKEFRVGKDFYSTQFSGLDELEILQNTKDKRKIRTIWKNESEAVAHSRHLEDRLGLVAEEYEKSIVQMRWENTKKPSNFLGIEIPDNPKGWFSLATSLVGALTIIVTAFGVSKNKWAQVFLPVDIAVLAPTIKFNSLVGKEEIYKFSLSRSTERPEVESIVESIYIGNTKRNIECFNSQDNQQIESSQFAVYVGSPDKPETLRTMPLNVTAYESVPITVVGNFDSTGPKSLCFVAKYRTCLTCGESFTSHKIDVLVWPRRLTFDELKFDRDRCLNEGVNCSLVLRFRTGVFDEKGHHIQIVFYSDKLEVVAGSVSGNKVNATVSKIKSLSDPAKERMHMLEFKIDSVAEFSEFYLIVKVNKLVNLSKEEIRRIENDTKVLVSGGVGNVF